MSQNNPIVYTCTGRRSDRSQPASQNVPVTRWMSEQRVTPERHAKAKQALRELYIIKAAAVGMTLDGYITRFNIKLN